MLLAYNQSQDREQQTYSRYQDKQKQKNIETDQLQNATSIQNRQSQFEQDQKRKQSDSAFKQSGFHSKVYNSALARALKAGYDPVSADKVAQAEVETEMERFFASSGQSAAPQMQQPQGFSPQQAPPGAQIQHQGQGQFSQFNPGAPTQVGGFAPSPLLGGQPTPQVAAPQGVNRYDGLQMTKTPLGQAIENKKVADGNIATIKADHQLAKEDLTLETLKAKLEGIHEGNKEKKELFPVRFKLMEKRVDIAMNNVKMTGAKAQYAIPMEIAKLAREEITHDKMAVDMAKSAAQTRHINLMNVMDSALINKEGAAGAAALKYKVYTELNSEEMKTRNSIKADTKDMAKYEVDAANIVGSVPSALKDKIPEGANPDSPEYHTYMRALQEAFGDNPGDSDTVKKEKLKRYHIAASAPFTLKSLHDAQKTMRESLSQTQESLSTITARKSAYNVPLNGSGPREPNAMMDKAVFRAERQLGHAYKYGAQGRDGKGVDCSAFVQNIYYGLPRTADEQYLALKKGEFKDAKQLRKGDLIFLHNDVVAARGGKRDGAATHVGFYAGDGVVYEASSAQKHVVMTRLNNFIGHGDVLSYNHVPESMVGGVSSRNAPSSSTTAKIPTPNKTESPKTNGDAAILKALLEFQKSRKKK